MNEREMIEGEGPKSPKQLFSPVTGKDLEQALIKAAYRELEASSVNGILLAVLISSLVEVAKLNHSDILYKA